MESSLPFLEKSKKSGGKGGGESDSEAGAISCLLILVAAVLWTGHALHHSRLRFLTEGSLALIWGLVAGGGFFFYFEHWRGQHIPQTLVAFNYDIYMELLLPPIIFYAGFSIKKKDFFANFGALTLLGVAGTFLLAALLSLGLSQALHFTGLDQYRPIGNSIALGTVFASTDSVAALQALDASAFPQLFALVFGEAVVNDATAIVLLRAVQHIRTEDELNASVLGSVLLSFFKLALLSLFVGVAIGLASAWILKHSFQKRHSTDHEVSLLAVLGFLSYLFAEYVGLSGVFATFFTGLVMSHYSWYSLSPSSKVSCIYAFRVLAFLAELLMFLSCGLDLWSTELWHKDLLAKKVMFRKMVQLSAWLSLVVPIARFLVAIPLLLIVNLIRRPGNRISWRNGLALGWAGIARGAVTLALAVNHFISSKDGGGGAGPEEMTEARIIAAASMIAIVLSTVVLGGVTPTVFEWLLSSPNPTATTTTAVPVSLEYHPSLGGGGMRSASSSQDPSGNSNHFPALLTGFPRSSADSLKEPLLLSKTMSTTSATESTSAALRINTLPRHVQQQQPLPQRLFVVNQGDEEQQEDEGVPPSSSSPPPPQPLLQQPPSFHARWTYVDRRFLQPLFGGRNSSFNHSMSRDRSTPSSPSSWGANPITHPTGGVGVGTGVSGVAFASTSRPSTQQPQQQPQAQGDASQPQSQSQTHPRPSPFSSLPHRRWGSRRHTTLHPSFKNPPGGVTGVGVGDVGVDVDVEAGGREEDVVMEEDISVLEKLFSQPGEAVCEEEVDKEVEREGLDQQAESYLEH